MQDEKDKIVSYNVGDNTHVDNSKKDKIFPILRKFDAIWQKYPDLSFHELYKLIVVGEGLHPKDDRFLQLLTEFIERDAVKLDGKPDTTGEEASSGGL